MSNIGWILMPVVNGRELTRRALVSCFYQQGLGVPIRVFVIDNNTTDGTVEMLRPLYPKVVTHTNRRARSVAESWNFGIDTLFSTNGSDPDDAILVVNNDVELRPDTYKELLKHGGSFVTAVGNNDPKCTSKISPITADPRPHPDFSCYLIRRGAWEKVGKFDEKFKPAFCEDWDYHCRLHQAGIEAVCIDLPFYHVGSATIKNLPEEEAEALSQSASRNREYFQKKWGFMGGTPEYEAFFKAPSQS